METNHGTNHIKTRKNHIKNMETKHRNKKM